MGVTDPLTMVRQISDKAQKRNCAQPVPVSRGGLCVFNGPSMVEYFSSSARSRCEEAASLRDRGATLAEIGAAFRVSPSRAGQMIQKAHLVRELTASGFGALSIRAAKALRTNKVVGDDITRSEPAVVAAWVLSHLSELNCGTAMRAQLKHWAMTIASGEEQIGDVILAVPAGGRV